VAPVLLEDPEFQTLHQQFRTKIDLGIALLEAAIAHKVPLSVLLFDSWYLAEELVSMARYRKKDWISLLKKNRNLETHSFTLKDAAGNPLGLEGPQIAVEDLVPLIPPTAYRAVTVRDKTSWTFTLAVRLPGLGKVRLVVSFKSAELTGTYVVLVTNRVDWDAQRIITLYVQRWPIEVFQSQDIKFTRGAFFFGRPQQVVLQRATRDVLRPPHLGTPRPFRPRAGPLLGGPHSLNGPSCSPGECEIGEYCPRCVPI